MSLALARKYRPRRFADVAVQSHVATTLRNAIAHNRVAHAYLFCGPRGTGKTTLARVLAMALNCENRQPDHEPCGVCTSCTRIWAGSTSLDVVEIDAASNRGVDDARDLRERAMYAPSGQDHYKVYIIDEAHMLTREAWNALLKILEEPPPRVVFVFATTEPQKIAQTAAPVLSRVQRFDLRRIGPHDVRQRLSTVLAAEGVRAEGDALGLLARAADGSMRDALSLTDQVLALGEGEVTVAGVRAALGLVHEDEYLALFDLIAERRAGDVFAEVGRLADAGVDFSLLLAGLGDAMRALLAVQLGGAVADLSEQYRGELKKRASHVTAPDLLRMLTMLVEIEPHFRRSGQQQLLIETMLVRFALLDRTVAIEDVLRGLDDGSPTGRTTAPRVAAARREPVVPRAVPLSRSSAAAAAAAPAPAPVSVSVVSTPPSPATPPAASPATRDRDHVPLVVGHADAPPASSPKSALDINRLAERWDDVVEAVRAAGRGVVASALAQSVPEAVTAAGAITIGVVSEALAEAIAGGSDAVLTAFRSVFHGVDRVVVKAIAGGSAAPRRLTADIVTADRVAQMRKREPLLDAAIDALDLRLIE